MLIERHDHKVKQPLMDIEGLIRELGPVDIAQLSETILAQEEAAWHEDSYRQETYEVHRQTESIVMVFTELENWPKIDVRKEPGWDRLVDVAVPVMHDIIKRHYPPGGFIMDLMRSVLQ